MAPGALIEFYKKVGLRPAEARFFLRDFSNRDSEHLPAISPR